MSRGILKSEGRQRNPRSFQDPDSESLRDPRALEGTASGAIPLAKVHPEPSPLFSASLHHATLSLARRSAAQYTHTRRNNTTARGRWCWGTPRVITERATRRANTHGTHDGRPEKKLSRGGGLFLDGERWGGEMGFWRVLDFFNFKLTSKMTPGIQKCVEKNFFGKKKIKN